MFSVMIVLGWMARVAVKGIQRRWGLYQGTGLIEIGPFYFVNRLS